MAAGLNVMFSQLRIGWTSMGAFQPPMNSVTVNADRMNTFTYSAKKKKPKRMPEYSVAKPATISLSASVRSNGVRLPSAVAAMKKITNASGCWKTYQFQNQPDWFSTIWLSDERAGQHDHADRRQQQRQLVADDLGRGANAAQQRVLIEARPAAHHQADHGQPADREEVEQTNVHVEADQARRERDDQQGQHGGEVDDDRREGEHRRVGAGRREVLLGQHLEAVEDRRQRAPRPGPVRARRARRGRRSPSSP